MRETADEAWALTGIVSEKAAETRLEGRLLWSAEMVSPCPDCVEAVRRPMKTLIGHE